MGWVILPSSQGEGEADRKFEVAKSRAETLPMLTSNLKQAIGDGDERAVSLASRATSYTPTNTLAHHGLPPQNRSLDAARLHPPSAVTACARSCPPRDCRPQPRHGSWWPEGSPILFSRPRADFHSRRCGDDHPGGAGQAPGSPARLRRGHRLQSFVRMTWKEDNGFDKS